MTLPRIPAASVSAKFIGDSLTKAVANIVPVHKVRFTEKELQDPKAHAQQLTKTIQSIVDATQAARSNPINSHYRQSNISCGNGGDKVTILHGLGSSNVGWCVVDWSDPDGSTITASPILVRDADTDTNRLVLRSYETGVASVMVWPG